MISFVADRPMMIAGVHLCRGNRRSAWVASGGYEPVAEVLFNEIDVDRFLLEFDDERSGGFEPLRFVPRGKMRGAWPCKLEDLCHGNRRRTQAPDRGSLALRTARAIGA